VSQQVAEGDNAGAEATLRRILELAPDHVPAQGRLLDMLAARDPAGAVAYARGLVDAADPASPRLGALRRWLGRACDLAGDQAGAVQAWSEGQAQDLAGDAGRMTALPVITAADAPRAEAAEAPAEAPAIALLAGLPGSGVDRVARLLDQVVPVFRSDRFGPRPPLPQALLLFALRDPRDMLLDWLSSGGHMPLRMGTPADGARWLAAALEHIAVLDEQKLHPHVLLRLDDTINSPQEMAGPVAEALGVQLPVPPPGLFGSQRFPAGHWRSYAGPLADAFAVPSPVAVRLGYPQD
jgi:hypothetical protein